MKRANKPKTATAQWRKIGGGLFTLKNGTVVTQGNTFSAEEADIPAAFRDLFERVSATEEVVEIEDTFHLVQVENNMYNVEDANGEALNEKPLELEEAKKLLAEVNA